jgi:hypothetical protein
MAEIESGETYSGIKLQGLNRWVSEVYNLFLIASRVLQNKKPANKASRQPSG